MSESTIEWANEIIARSKAYNEAHAARVAARPVSRPLPSLSPVARQAPAQSPREVATPEDSLDPDLVKHLDSVDGGGGEVSVAAGEVVEGVGTFGHAQLFRKTNGVWHTS